MSQEFEVTAVTAPVIIGATGLDDIAQCIRNIARTTMFSTPMDCAFASDGACVDSPIPHATAARIANLTEAIELHESRVRVTSISFSQRANDAIDGRVFPVIRFRLHEEVRL
jgi:phage baseplate assembly protein W